MVECSAYSTYKQTQEVKFAAWPTSWRLPGADQISLTVLKVNSRIWLCAVDESTINKYCLVHYYFLTTGNPW